ncbi:uncharacterized protein LOC143281360 [Babylonia areolata]|uniref:uncharacterized protein LOC143281360 n=1 Tax=Babylonia areolata TaxID=304850 RepID=UPI003FD67E6D
MGVSSQLFVQPVDPNLLCAVCGGVLEQAVLTPCGHSFCSPCLHTWLATPTSTPKPPTCPECRAEVPPRQVKPVHALRNIVRGLAVWCHHRHEGCQDAVPLDRLPAHLRACPYHPVACTGCGQRVRRLDLAHHHLACAAIAASIDGDDEDDVHVTLLMNRIRTLEGRLERLVQDLRCARSKTVNLEREFHKVSDHFRFTLHDEGGQQRHHHDEGHQQRHHHHHVHDTHTRCFLQEECARGPATVAQLSLLIARHLLEKPGDVDSGEVFGAIGRCVTALHMSGTGGGPDCRHDVHMLLATAFASNWFSPCQRLSLYRWLQTMTTASVAQTVAVSLAADTDRCFCCTCQRLSLYRWLQTMTTASVARASDCRCIAGCRQ